MEFYLGQILLFGFNFAPEYWAACQGQLLPIAQNQSLFSLLGTTYGGDGIDSFALPNMPPVASEGPHDFIYINAKSAMYPQRPSG